MTIKHFEPPIGMSADEAREYLARKLRDNTEIGEYHVDSGVHCLLWTGARRSYGRDMPKGAGLINWPVRVGVFNEETNRVSMERKYVRLPRLIWMAEYGFIDDRYNIRLVCGNRHCVEVKHMMLGLIVDSNTDPELEHLWQKDWEDAEAVK